MKKFIHKYLSAHYYVSYNPNKKGEHIFSKVTSRSVTSRSVTSRKLIKELSLIFSLEKDKLKWYIKSWTKKDGKTFNFTRWWNPKHYLPKSKKLKLKFNFDAIGFPTIRRVFSQVAANDIVQVQPMRAPTGLLHHLDLYMGVDVARDDVQDVAVFQPYVDENTREMTLRRWRASGLLEGLVPRENDIFRLYEAQRNQIIW